MEQLLKNPLLLGVVAGVVTYVFLYYRAQNNNKDKDDIEKESISILTPGLIGLFVWFISASYFDSLPDNSSIIDINSVQGKAIANKAFDGNMKGGSYNLSTYSGTVRNSMSDLSINNTSYHLIGKNKIRVPAPDIFIDVAKF
jgi:hypothetical protein